MQVITVKEIEYIAFRMAQELLSYNEPIPDFSTRFPNSLESCLAIPFLTFSGKSLYPNFISKASILFYLIIKNYPFQNGNKRIAITTLFIFLYKNKKWMSVSTMELYNFTVWIAQSPHNVNKEVVKAIEKFLKVHIVKL